MIPRILKIFNWVLFGTDEHTKAKLIDFFEKVIKEGKNIEVTANKSGEITLKFRKEF